MVHSKPGYWDHEQCRWIGAEERYVVPAPAAVDAPAVDAVPEQRLSSGTELMSEDFVGG